MIHNFFIRLYLCTGNLSQKSHTVPVLYLEGIFHPCPVDNAQPMLEALLPLYVCMYAETANFATTDDIHLPIINDT